MKDTIYRQDAINAHCELCPDKGKCNHVDLCPDVEVFNLLQSANDLISRQAVKEWLAKWEGYLDADMIARMQYRVIDIPSAQQEIIRCRDCVKREICRTTTIWAVAPSDDWFCADGERRKG